MRDRHFFASNSNLVILFGLSGLAIGCLTQYTLDQLTGGKNLWPVFASLSLPVLLITAIRPIIGAGLVLAFAFVNPSVLPPVLELGELSLRYVDVAFAILLGAVTLQFALQRGVRLAKEFRQIHAPIFVFLLYIGASLVTVYFSAPGFYSVSVAAYMRLVMTACFALVLHVLVRDSWDLHFFHKVLLGLAMISVGVGALLAGVDYAPGQTDTLVERSGGILGFASLGLVSGLLILYAILRRDERSSGVLNWLIPLTLGVLGLYLAKSAISIFATAAVATLALTVMRSRKTTVPRLLKGIALGTILAVISVVAVLNVRKSDTEGITRVSSGSFAERIMIGYAGLQIFLNNPLTGVGWQASTAETVIGSYALRMDLMEHFRQLPTHYFLKPPSSLHNMYVQFLAELGVIGFALFVWISIRVGKTLAEIVRNVPADSPYRIWVKFDVLALVFLLIWWNVNPLFGGQTEWMLAITFLALLGTLPRLEKQRTNPLPHSVWSHQRPMTGAARHRPSLWHLSDGTRDSQ